MQRSDIRAVGDLAGEASSVLTTLVRGMHAGISGRVFDSIGPSATPTRTIHDGLTRAIYSGVDRGIRGAGADGAVAAICWSGREAVVGGAAGIGLPGISWWLTCAAAGDFGVDALHGVLQVD